MFINDPGFHARHYMEILRQKKEEFGEIKKVKKISSKEFYIKIMYWCGLPLTH